MKQKNLIINLALRNPLLRELITFAPIYFFLALINLLLKLQATPAWTDGTLVRWHDLFLRFAGPNNEQSRLLQFLIPELIHTLLRVSIENAYMIQRLIFIFLVLTCFHFYMRAWFGARGAFSGVVLLAALMPLTYMNHLQESSSLLMLTFLVSLWAIRDNRTFLLIASLFIGGLNNETMLILPMVYFFYNYRSPRPRSLLHLVWRTVLVNLPLFVTVATIRYITRNNPQLAAFWQLPNNIAGILSALRDAPFSRDLFIFYMYNMFWLYAFVGLRRKPLFLRRAAPLIPVFVIVHFLVAMTNEVRLMLPISFLVIPLGLFTLYEHGGPTATVDLKNTLSQ